MSETIAQRAGVCGCCAGVEEATPGALFNLPGLPALAYRVGTHARFKESMLVGLTRAPALRALTTRDDDDPTIALIDAWAAALDVLTFYEERIANEGYLLTAVEQRSIRELARAIGYELGPGVAGQASVAFELETAVGAPESARIPVGTKVQSVPGQDELPQTYETVEEIEARPQWNAMRARTRTPSPPAGAMDLYVKGTATSLRVGDRILLTDENESWAVRRLSSAEVLPDGDVTRVAWTTDDPASSGNLVPGPATSGLKVFALRLRASLFGHNAPDWKAMPAELQSAYDGLTVDDEHGDNWPNNTISEIADDASKNQVFLDASYPEVVAESWAVLRAPGENDALFKVENATEDQRTDFTMSSKTTRLDFDDDATFASFNDHLRDTTVFAHSEELALAEWPVADPVQGAKIKLDPHVPRLDEGRSLIVSGVRARMMYTFTVTKLIPDDGSDAVTVVRGDIVELLGPPKKKAGKLIWPVVKDGVHGKMKAAKHHTVGVPAPDEAPVIAEAATTGPPPSDDELQDTLVLTAKLRNAYEPRTVRVAANVALATNGETRKQPLGSGDASTPFQRFILKDGPLTYTQSSGSTGGATTLGVRVNGLLWHEARSLYGRAPRDRVYVVRDDDAGNTTVEFGDGTTGARLPTGTQNVQATYRVGTGLAGQVGAEKVTLLMGAPLGVKAVTNPLPATGADNPETGDRARDNAPLTVRTFERVVSLHDVEDFAAAFAGVGKAAASRLWDGEADIVHLTIAGADGTPPKQGSDLLENLQAAVMAAGDPHLRLRIAPYIALPFAVEARLFVASDFESDVVVAAASSALAEQFSFEQRAFAQPVAVSEVVATIHSVDGVDGVDMLGLHVVGKATEPGKPLVAEPARFGAGVALPAELLTIAPDAIAVTAA